MACEQRGFKEQLYLELTEMLTETRSHAKTCTHTTQWPQWPDVTAAVCLVILALSTQTVRGLLKITAMLCGTEHTEPLNITLKDSHDAPLPQLHVLA